MEEKAYYANQDARVGPKQGPVDRLRDAVERLAKASSHTDELAARMVGSVPEGTATPLREVSSPGLLGELDELAATVARLAEIVVSNVSRINSRL